MEAKGKKSIRPPRLYPGDTIGIAAPAGPLDFEELEAGIDVLTTMGFNTFIPDDLFIRQEYLAGSDHHRANQVNGLFENSEIDAIFCARGGYGSMRILSLLDYSSITSHPKIFVGFSDITALLSTFYMKCGFVTFHGPVTFLLGTATEEAREALFSMITSDLKHEITPEKGVVIKSGSASGPVIGGNLTTLCHLIGTEFEPELKGHILLIEDQGEASYRIDRMLTQMKLAGCLNGLVGVILGTFEDCGSMDEIYDIVGGVFEDYSIPILGGFEIGHGRNNITVPLGITATLDTDKQSLLFHESPTEP